MKISAFFLIAVLASLPAQARALSSDDNREICQSFYNTFRRGGYSSPGLFLRIRPNGTLIRINKRDSKVLRANETLSEPVASVTVKAFTDSKGRVTAVQHLSRDQEGNLNGAEIRFQYDRSGFCLPYGGVIPIYGFDGDSPIYPPEVSGASRSIQPSLRLHGRHNSVLDSGR